MRTVSEVVRDVLANPEVYEGVFPVAGPERVLVAFDPETATITMGGINELANGAALTPEMMEAVRQRMRWGRWSDGETHFVRDESLSRDRVTMVNVPLRENSAFRRALEGRHPRYVYPNQFFAPRYNYIPDAGETWAEATQRFSQDMANLTAIDDPSMGMGQNYEGNGDSLPSMQHFAEQVGDEVRPRPDHYRVTPGRCHCGFTSMFTGDMIDHIGGRVFIANNHQWTWRLCECRASALCRAVRTVMPLGIDFDNPPTEPVPMPTRTDYLCNACCQRRGI
jgi:hypothetical protein